jgi:hypothetical protein
VGNILLPPAGLADGYYPADLSRAQKHRLEELEANLKRKEEYVD